MTVCIKNNLQEVSENLERMGNNKRQIRFTEGGGLDQHGGGHSEDSNSTSNIMALCWAYTMLRGSDGWVRTHNKLTNRMNKISMDIVVQVITFLQLPN